MSRYLQAFLGILAIMLFFAACIFGGSYGMFYLLEWLRLRVGVGGAVAVYLIICLVAVAALIAIPASRKDRKP